MPPCSPINPCLLPFPNLRAAADTHRRAILVDDTKAIAEIAHPLLELARRLPSKIEMRRLPDEHVPSRNFIVVDDAAIWVQPDSQAYVGWLNLNDRVEARRLSGRVHARCTNRSTDDPELRLLSL